MNSLLDYSAVALREQIERREVRSVDVVAAYLERIEQLDGQIGAFLAVDRSGAMAQAEAVDHALARNQPLGLLAGIPVALKDILCTRGQPTTCGSKMLANFVPPYDATVVTRLKQAGAVLVGKTNLDEFAMGSSTENSALGRTRNPWDLERVPGGSSGGSAACVAASLAPLAVGTDTGGSIRQPAAFCGVVGLKPTYGRVSRYGLVAFASSLDQVGPLGRWAEDVALLLEVLAGHDPLDSTSANVPVPSFSRTVTQPLENLRLGVPEEHFGEGLDHEVASTVEEAIRVFQRLGAAVQTVHLPHSRYAIATYYVIAPCEASSNLARYDGAHYGYRTNEARMLRQLEEERQHYRRTGQLTAADDLDPPLVRMYRQTRAEGFGAEVKRRIMLGTYALSAGYYDAYYLKALKVRRLIRQDYDAAFRDVDLLVGPVAPTPAFRFGEKSTDPLAMYLEDLYTVGANLAGIPGISVPCGFSAHGLPIGLQLQGPAMSEERLLRAAWMFQQKTDWHMRRPRWI